jgi:acetoacetyl-CoA reductase
MKSRIALVTGGTGGIGSSICCALHAQGVTVVAGYSHGGSDVKAKAWQQAQKENDRHFGIVFGDVSHFESSGEMIRCVEAEYGPIDILINNAGIVRDATLRKMELSVWEAVLRVNLDGVFNTCHHVINGMIERQFGRIINISSINGQKGQFGQTNYSASKAGIYGFTKALAQEVASKGITVNSVSPGYVKTDLLANVPEAILNKIIAQIPVGRLAEPDEIGRVVAFLADDASAFITGADFSINGGQYM